VIGGVGVSGAAGDEDEYCGLAGVMAAEIPHAITEPTHHSLKS